MKTKVKAPKVKVDVEVEGQWGMHTFHQRTPRALRWVEANVDLPSYQRAGDFSAMSTDMAEAIVKGMLRSRLVVAVNGRRVKAWGGRIVEAGVSS